MYYSEALIWCVSFLLPVEMAKTLTPNSSGCMLFCVFTCTGFADPVLTPSTLFFSSTGLPQTAPTLRHLERVPELYLQLLKAALHNRHGKNDKNVFLWLLMTPALE